MNHNIPPSDLTQTQPLNSVLNAEIDDVTEQVEQLDGEISNVRASQIPPSVRSKIEKSHQFYVAEWRKRKQIGESALTVIEESTDEVVKKNKCLSGQGQIECVGDELHLKEILGNENENENPEPPARKKLKFGSKLGKAKSSSNSASESESEREGDPFVGLMLDRSLKSGVRRVYRVL